MQVVAAGQPGTAGVAQNDLLRHAVTRFHGDLAQVGIHAEETESVVHNDRLAVNSDKPGVDHHSAVGRWNGGVDEGGQIHAQMVLLVDFLTLVEISAVVGKTGARRRVGQPQERALPEYGPFRFARRRNNFPIVCLAQVAVDQQELVLQCGVGLRRQQRMKLRQDLMDEAVAHLQGILFEGLFAEVVGKARARAVSGQIRRLQRDLGSGALQMADGKKGDEHGLVAIIPIVAGKKAGAHPHPAGRAGLREAIDRQSGSALVDVILLVQIFDDRGPSVDDDLGLQLGDIAVPPVAPGIIPHGDPQRGFAVAKTHGARVDFDRGGFAPNLFQAENAGGGKRDVGQHNVFAVLAQRRVQAAQAAVGVRDAERQLRRFAQVHGRGGIQGY